MKNPKALNFALKLISKRDRTEAELRDRLIKKGFSEEELEYTLNYLKERGFIDDRKFIKNADKIAEDRLLGKSGIEYYFLKKGLKKELLEEIGEIDEYSIAMRLLRKKSYLFDEEPFEKKKAKIAGLLLRRGFSWDTINKCLKSVTGGGQ